MSLEVTFQFISYQHSLGRVLFRNLRRLKPKHAINLLHVCRKAKCNKVHVIKEKQRSDNSGPCRPELLKHWMRVFQMEQNVQFFKSSKFKIKIDSILYECDFLVLSLVYIFYITFFFVGDGVLVCLVVFSFHSNSQSLRNVSSCHWVFAWAVPSSWNTPSSRAFHYVALLILCRSSSTVFSSLPLASVPLGHFLVLGLYCNVHKVSSEILFLDNLLCTSLDPELH